MAVEIYEVVFSGTLAGQFVQTVQHVKATIAAPVSTFQSALYIAQDIAANGIQDAFAAMVPADYIMTSIRVRRVGPSGGPTGATGVGSGGSLRLRCLGLEASLFP